MKIQNPLQYYVDKIAKGETYSLARYGDGELLCMRGRQGANSNGCYYTSELRVGLVDSMEPRPNFIHGMQRVLPNDEGYMLEFWHNIKWHDSEVFGEAAAEGELDNFIAEVNKHPVTVIGNYSIRDATLKLFPNRWFIEIPPMNALTDKLRVIDSILWEDRFSKEPKVYLFSAGMAANVMVSELHGRVKGWLLDVGHIWDPFAGSRSRCDL